MLRGSQREGGRDGGQKEKQNDSHQPWQCVRFSFLVQKCFGNTAYLIPFAFLKPSAKTIRVIQFQCSKSKFIMFPEEPQKSKMQNTGQIIKK